MNHIKAINSCTGKVYYGKAIKETKCYVTVEIKKFYSNGNSLVERLYKRDGAMYNENGAHWDLNFYAIYPEDISDQPEHDISNDTDQPEPEIYSNLVGKHLINIYIEIQDQGDINAYISDGLIVESGDNFLIQDDEILKDIKRLYEVVEKNTKSILCARLMNIINSTSDKKECNLISDVLSYATRLCLFNSLNDFEYNNEAYVKLVDTLEDSYTISSVFAEQCHKHVKSVLPWFNY